MSKLTKKELVWDKILDALIDLKADKVLSDTEYKNLKDDIELIVDGMEE